MSTEVEVLLLSSLADLSTDRICHHLANVGVGFLRINREQFLDLRITIDPLGATMSCRFGSKEWQVGSSLKSVWWRQPTFLRNTPGRSLSTTEQLEKSQWAAMMRGMMLFDSACWFNHPMKTYGAECKLLQLRKAAQIGFRVPITRITNDKFADIPSVIGSKVAVKSIDTVLLFEAENQHFGYTSILDWVECADEAFHTVPATVQAVVSPKLDLRVTVIGQSLWCVQISDNDFGIEGDWRLRPKTSLQFRDYELPPEVAKLCFELVAIFELRYAAIDLAFSGDDYWFIEINPTGEWGWLDRDGRRISETIAEQLTCPI